MISERPQVSVVVVNYNGRAHLERCLPALFSTAEIPIEVIVVDNASSDDSVSWVGAHHPQVRLLTLDRNYGFGEGNRRGIEAARDEYVALLNSDTVVEPGWLRALMRAFERDPDVVAACSLLRLLDKPELLNAFGGGMTWIGFGYDHGMFFPYDPSYFAGLQPVETFFPTAAAMLMKKADFNSCGGFDTTFFMYHEDVDLGWRLWLQGKKVVVCADSIVYHAWGGTTRSERGLRWREKLGARHNVRSLIKNYELSTLLRALGELVRVWRSQRAYTLMLHALLWNLLHLPGTLNQRRRIQKGRVRKDGELLATLIAEPGFPPAPPEARSLDVVWGAEHWLISPTLLPGCDSALARLGYGWYLPEQEEDTTLRTISGDAEAYLKVAPAATGHLTVSVRLPSTALSDRPIVICANESETTHRLQREDWEKITLPATADQRGLIRIKISSPVWAPNDSLKNGDFRRLGCAVRKIRFEENKPAKQEYGSFTVIIPSYNRWDILKENLEALERQTYKNFEVIVVDDFSIDGTWWKVKQWQQDHPGLKIKVLWQENSGPGQARNYALHYASGDLVLFLNDDTVPDARCLEHHLRKHNKLGEAGAVLGFTDWHREKMTITPFLEFIHVDGQQFGYGYLHDGGDVPFTCFYTSNISLPRSLLGENPFNPSIKTAGWDDTELGYRLSLRGMRIVFCLAAETRHFHPMDMVSFFGRQKKIGQAIHALLSIHPELENNVRMPPPAPPPLFALRFWSTRILLPLFNRLDQWMVSLPAPLYRSMLLHAFFYGKERL